MKELIIKNLIAILQFAKRGLKLFYWVYAKMTVKEMGKKCHINSLCRFTRNTYIGNDASFNGIKMWSGGKIKIGNHFHSGEGCKILAGNHNYNGSSLPYDESVLSKDVVIEDNVWIGIDVIILPGAILREGCIIQAGSVVVGEIPYCAIAGGHPAQVYSYRDIENYEMLRRKQLEC